MLRRVIAILLFALLGCGFFGWSRYKANTVSELQSHIDTLSYYAEKEDYSNALYILNGLEKIQEKRKSIFNLVHSHQLMNSLADYISDTKVSILRKDKTELTLAISRMRNLIDDYYEDSKINLVNII